MTTIMLPDNRINDRSAIHAAPSVEDVVRIGLQSDELLVVQEPPALLAFHLYHPLLDQAVLLSSIKEQAL